MKIRKMISKKGQLKIQVHKNSKKFLVSESSKGQLKIQEMAFMLVAVVLFFILVGLFALSIWSKNIEKSAINIAEEKTLSAIENLAGTAEFICPNNKPNCVDGDKLMALKDKEIYEDFLEFSSLSIIKGSGFAKNETDLIECSLGNYPNCDIIKIYDKNIRNERVVKSFVALCRREFENSAGYEKCEMAKLNAGTELKK